MDPFELFDVSDYQFLKLASKDGGNVVVQEYQTTTGIVKLRDELLQTDNMEVRDSKSSVHIRPNETFVADLKGRLMGHGIRVVNDEGESIDYKIDGQYVGKDFDTGKVLFYRVTLKKESLAAWPSELPIE